MTDKKERFNVFLERCVNIKKGNINKTIRIDGKADQKREAKRFRNLSEYHKKAAQQLLNSTTSLIAIKEGYYAMLHKANEALALAGFKTRTHECTLLGIRGVFNKPNLADILRRASKERKNVDYYMNPENPDLSEFIDSTDFVKNAMNSFIEEMNKIISQYE